MEFLTQVKLVMTVIQHLETVAILHAKKKPAATEIWIRVKPATTGTEYQETAVITNVP